MNSKLFFLQLLLATVMGQDLAAAAVSGDSVAAEASGDALIESLAAAQQQLPAAATSADVAKETSVELAAATPVVMNGQDGDVAGPKLRQNLFHFGSPAAAPRGRTHADCAPAHGFREPCEWERERAPAPCDAPYAERYPPLPLPPAHAPCHDHHRHHGHPVPDLAPLGRGPVVGPEEVPPPYLRVTPSLFVQPSTRTHVETSTSTHFDVSTHLRTRTVTEELLSTKTHIFHPEHTYTIVDRRTYLEYPGSTIDPAHVRGPLPTTAPEWSDRTPFAPCY